MIGYRKIWLISMLTVAALIAGPAVVMVTADRQNPGQSPTELLLFYANDVRGEIAPCG